ncbi:MAG: VOC family protein [Burkholderiales bacterium]
MIEGLAHIGLFIRNIEVSKKFYTETLGFEIVSEADMPDGTKVAMAKRGDLMIEIVQLPDYKNYLDGFVNHIAMRVTDIDKVQKELESKGIQFETKAPVPMDILNGVRYLMFRGPDGEHLEIVQLL